MAKLGLAPLFAKNLYWSQLVPIGTGLISSRETEGEQASGRHPSQEHDAQELDQ
jgi:hypothetical protein